ncbi:MAG: glycine radical domain-containing protein [Evtepia gabavorous]
MIQTLFALGGFHVRFNCISSKPLRDAQAHPENYRDLLVRVSGYSTQFVNLSRAMQDAIIAPGRAQRLRGAYGQLHHPNPALFGQHGEGIRTLIFLAGCPSVVPGAPTRRADPGES